MLALGAESRVQEKLKALSDLVATAMRNPRLNRSEVMSAVESKFMMSRCSELNVLQKLP